MDGQGGQLFCPNFYSEDRTEEKRDILTGRVIEDFPKKCSSDSSHRTIRPQG